MARRGREASSEQQEPEAPSAKAVPAATGSSEAGVASRPVELPRERRKAESSRAVPARDSKARVSNQTAAVGGVGAHQVSSRVVQ